MTKSITQLVEENFPGANNAGLRRRAIESWQSSGSVLGLAKVIALTTSGLKSLEALEQDLIDYRDSEC